MEHPRLRDGKRLVTAEPYPINEIPKDLIVKIGGFFVHLLYIVFSYCLFEEENHRFRTSDYIWETNANGNLIGKNVETGDTCFTWQPHGSQFTIHTRIPENAVKFTIKQPPLLTKDEILRTVKFDESWVNIINANI